MNAKNLIQKLELQPHPEGGWYRETYRSAETMTNKNGEKRNVCTAIYFLLEGNDKSHFHRIQADETWFFHCGEPLEILLIEGGNLRKVLLGNDILKGEVPQFVIPSRTWFAARIKTGTGFSLVSCTVAPGFEFLDFELGKREILLTHFPALSEEITSFTIE